MKRIAVFPYNKDVQTLIDNRKMITEYEIVAVISYREDCKRMKVLNQNSDIYYGTDLEKVCDMVDAILLCENVQEFELTGYYNKIKIAANYEKEILISSILYRQIGLDKFDNCKIHILDEDWPVQDYCSSEIFDIDIPIISILGMGENCDKFSLQLEVYKQFIEREYNVMLISSNSLGALLGVNPLPEFLFKEDISLVKKTINFNHMLYDLVNYKKPEIIILGYPGGVMPVNKFKNNFFSEIPIIISNSIESDAGIFSTFFLSRVSNKLYTELKEILKIKFNVSVDDFCMAQQQYSTNREKRQIEYRFFNDDIYTGQFPDIKDVDYNIFSVLNKESISNIVDNFVGQLEENIDIL